MSVSPRIAIIGAGPAGLTLARLFHLSRTSINFTVYEIDASATSRPDQGGTLDLHADTGLAAIRKCDLWDVFQQHARYDGQEMIFRDKNATKLVHVGGGKPKEGGRPEIDRHKLRKILLDSVPQERVKWGCQIEEVTKEGYLKLRDGSEMQGPFDLIVGADGAWSKVRDLLHDQKPIYSEVSGYEMDIKKPHETCPHVDKMVGRGSHLGSSDAKFLNAQRLGDNSIKVRAWFRCPEGEASVRFKGHGKEAALDHVLQIYSSWDPQMIEIFKQGDINSLRPWTLYELPVGFKWKHQKGLTLIGDAASLATPFSGEGVNKAMKDALELAELIERSQSEKHLDLNLDQAVLEYELEMFPRAEKLQRNTIENKEAAFGPTAPIGIMTNMMKRLGRDSTSLPVKAVGSFPVVSMMHSYLWTRIQVGWLMRTFWRRT
jgi:2-polyprenyl-6-methoxyphenol hydroxylase-like FAD-dependent oxidoreductase